MSLYNTIIYYKHIIIIRLYIILYCSILYYIMLYCIILVVIILRLLYRPKQTLKGANHLRAPRCEMSFKTWRTIDQQ